MTTSRPSPGQPPEGPLPAVDAVPPLDHEDRGRAQGERDGGEAPRDPAHAEVPSDAERAGTAEDEADAARRHREP